MGWILYEIMFWPAVGEEEDGPDREEAEEMGWPREYEATWFNTKRLRASAQVLSKVNTKNS